MDQIIVLVIVLAVVAVVTAVIVFTHWRRQISIWWQDRQEEKEIVSANNRHFKNLKEGK